jgi:hypothetical protein
MNHAEQLERETERTRAELATTLRELRACMTPGYLVDRLAEQASHGAGAEYARNLKNQVVANPLATALIGAGFAWLMLGSRHPASIHPSGRNALRRGDESHDTRSADDDVASESGIGQTASSIVHSIKETAVSGYDSMSETAGEAGEAIAHSARMAGRRSLQAGSNVLEFCREQPLVLAGLGIAIGALAGALLPESETEERMMGDASARAKRTARDMVSEQVETIKEGGESVMETLKGDGAGSTNTSQTAGRDGGMQDESASRPTGADGAASSDNTSSTRTRP